MTLAKPFQLNPLGGGKVVSRYGPLRLVLAATWGRDMAVAGLAATCWVSGDWMKDIGRAGGGELERWGD